MTAQFGEVRPRNGLGQLDIDFRLLTVASRGLDGGTIAQVTPYNSFRLGQQIFWWLGVANPVETIPDVQVSENWITRIQLKPWWARPNVERRQAGASNKLSPTIPRWLPIDQETFNSTTDVDNRYVWMPSPKRLDITEYQTPPPTASPPRHSDSLLVDDLWTMDLQDPNDPTYQSKFGPDQIVSRWAAFLYPAMGYGLGFTWEYETAFEPEPLVIATPSPLISLSWSTGTLGGTNYQESIG